MTDFRVRYGFLTHPKTEKLRRKLGNDAVVAFMQLWEFCGVTPGRQRGDLQGLDDDDIEIAAKWQGSPGDLVGALRAVRYLDGEPGRHQIHEFPEHQPHIAGKTDDGKSGEASEDGQEGNHIRWHENRGVFKPGCKWCEEERAAAEGGDVGGESGAMSPESGGESPFLPSFLPSDHPSNRSIPAVAPDEPTISGSEIIARALDEFDLGTPSEECRDRIEALGDVAFHIVSDAIHSMHRPSVRHPNWNYFVQALATKRAKADKEAPAPPKPEPKRLPPRRADEKWEPPDPEDYGTNLEVVRQARIEFESRTAKVGT